ncbi:MAG: hypothetical protein JSR46_12040 [Verrucomicrobia bacterium]|nr:hypothetical protein [Verrucomicrobiota bacterium]
MSVSKTQQQPSDSAGKNYDLSKIDVSKWGRHIRIEEKSGVKEIKIDNTLQKMFRESFKWAGVEAHYATGTTAKEILTQIAEENEKKVNTGVIKVIHIAVKAMVKAGIEGEALRARSPDATELFDTAERKFFEKKSPEAQIKIIKDVASEAKNGATPESQAQARKTVERLKQLYINQHLPESARAQFNKLPPEFADRLITEIPKIEKLVATLDALPPIKETTTDVGCTYAGSPKDKGPKANCDKSFIEGPSSLIADGPGHNDPQTREAMDAIFDPFFADYSSNYLQACSECKDIDQWKTWMQTQIHSLEGRISQQSKKDLQRPTEDTTDAFRVNLGQGWQMPFALTQIVKIQTESGPKLFLLTASASDCTLLIRKKDGSFDTRTIEQPKKDIGIGHEEWKDDQREIDAIEIEEGDEVFTYSDGIGDYITINEFKEILNKNEDRNKLREEIGNFIIEKADGSFKNEYVRTLRSKEYREDISDVVRLTTEKTTETLNKKFENFHAKHKSNFQGNLRENDYKEIQLKMPKEEIINNIANNLGVPEEELSAFKAKAQEWKKKREDYDKLAASEKKKLKEPEAETGWAAILSEKEPTLFNVKQIIEGLAKFHAKMALNQELTADELDVLASLKGPLSDDQMAQIKSFERSIESLPEEASAKNGMCALSGNTKNIKLHDIKSALRYDDQCLTSTKIG